MTLAAEKRAPQRHTITAEPGPKSTTATVCSQLFTFRLWMTAFALFDEQQGPLSSGNGDEVRTEADNGRVIRKGCNSP